MADWPDPSAVSDSHLPGGSPQPDRFGKESLKRLHRRLDALPEWQKIVGIAAAAVAGLVLLFGGAVAYGVMVKGLPLTGNGGGGSTALTDDDRYNIANDAIQARADELGVFYTDSHCDNYSDLPADQRMNDLNTFYCGVYDSGTNGVGASGFYLDVACQVTVYEDGTTAVHDCQN